MKLTDLLNALFPEGHNAAVDADVVHGLGRLDGRDVALIGTTEHAAIGVETALALAGHVLRVARDTPGMPILLLVDNGGQRLSRRDELLANNGYLAHLAKCLEVARARGHQILSLVYDQAISGGFLAARHDCRSDLRRTGGAYTRDEPPGHEPHHTDSARPPRIPVCHLGGVRTGRAELLQTRYRRGAYGKAICPVPCARRSPIARMRTGAA